jgi:hypothetical protein
MIRIDAELTLERLRPRLERVFGISAGKIRAIEKMFDASRGSPVFTVDGVYTAREWTDWTQGFTYGSALLQYDATGEEWFLEYGRRNTLARLTLHLTHTGVHDHGFNIVSTYRNLLRLAHEGKMAASEVETRSYALALKVSGAVQAARWSPIRDRRGYIYSFNGPHSLFADTIRSLRSLALAHRLGHMLIGESDRRISLLERLVHHASVTAEFSVYYGEGRDVYDVRGQVAPESIFKWIVQPRPLPGRDSGDWGVFFKAGPKIPSAGNVIGRPQSPSRIHSSMSHIFAFFNIGKCSADLQVRTYLTSFNIGKCSADLQVGTYLTFFNIGKGT